jgi:hypothetical protein
MAASVLPMTLIYLLWARPVNVKASQMTWQRGGALQSPEVSLVEIERVVYRLFDFYRFI